MLSHTSMCCGWLRGGEQSETKPCTSVSVPATVGNISNGFYQSEKSINLLQPGLDLDFPRVIRSRKLSAAELIEQHFQSVHHVMSGTCVLPHLPPGVWLLQLAAISYLTSARTLYNNVNTMAVWRRGNIRVYSGGLSRIAGGWSDKKHFWRQIWMHKSNLD